MGAIKRNIPNFITCLNLGCGFMGIIFLLEHRLEWVIYTVILAIFFDFIDGLSARLLKVTSPFGKDLDSLADIVTFGILPGVLMFKLISGCSHDLIHANLYNEKMLMFIHMLPYFAVLIPVFSAIRLAKFNNDSDQLYSFKGLPTPANGLVIVSLYYWIINEITKRVNQYSYDEMVSYPATKSDLIKVVSHPYFLVLITILLSFLLISKINLMAFKFKGFGWKANQWKYILLIVSIPLIIFLGFASAPIILLLYIVISQIHFRSVCP